MTTRTPVLRAVSWNLHSYGKSGPSRRREQRELLRFLRPDLLCLQEVYSLDPALTELEALVAEIADSLGMAYFAVPAQHSQCHLAVLWRPDFSMLSKRAYDLLLWHGLGIVRLDVGAQVPLAVAVTHLGPWDPDKQLHDTYTLTGQLPLTEATLLGADWNSFGADPGYDGEPDWSSLPPAWTRRHVPFNDDPGAPAIADRRPALLMKQSGFHDAAPTLGAPWKATGGHHGGWARREDVFWTTTPDALRGYQVVDTPASRRLSDHLPIVVYLDPHALTATDSPP